MSQFRIKNIDHATPDEWVYKANEGLNSVGDDIDARDPNELAEAIQDTQVLLLKASTLPSGALLKPNSGLAERITILEEIAGNSTLQDIYSNGNTISVLAGKPLTFGIREEFKLDDAGNLSFKPVTMKIKGSGFSTLDFTNVSVTSNLGDLLVGATSPGHALTLRAEEFFYLKDVFLSNPVTLSEPGNTALSTVSQSLVGAINELKSSSFNTSFQSVYSQSTPPKITTNSSQGGVVIEDPNATAVGDTLRIIGNLTVTRKTKATDLSIGNNTTIKDSQGLVTSDPIKTSDRVETPNISSGINELTLEDKRISVPLSDSSVAGLSTSKQSLAGAINELKQDILTVGGFTSLFDIQHDSSTGFHKIITTRSEIGQESTKRIVVQNQSGAEVFSVNGLGEIESSDANIGGFNILDIISQLSSHLADDGTSHAALAAHLSDPNPHNTVKSILGLSGDVSISSSDASITVSQFGNTVDIKSNASANLQSVYDNSFFKEMSLNNSGFSFIDEGTGQNILSLSGLSSIFNTDIAFEKAAPRISSDDSLELEPTSDLLLKSTEGDISISTTDPQRIVRVQNIDFNESGAQSLHSSLGTSVLGAFKKLGDNISIDLNNDHKYDINFVMPMFIDSNNRVWPHIANMHPANEFVSSVDYFWNNKGPFYYPSETVLAETGGTFYSAGTHNLQATSAASLPANFTRGLKLYPITLSYLDVEIDDVMSIQDQQFIQFDGQKSLTAVLPPAAPVVMDGDFALQQDTGIELERRADQTRDNIMATVNDYQFSSSGSSSYLKAGIWGDAPSFISVISGVVNDGDTFTIEIPFGLLSEALTTTFTARTSPSGWKEFQASGDPEVVAISLAEAINRTMFRSNSPTDSNGHRCKAEALGKAIKVEWYKPGLTGRLVSLQSSTPSFSYGNFSGGNCRLRIYDMQPSRASNISVTTDMSGISALPSAFSGKEKSEDYFITAHDAMSSKRYSPHYEARELGSIENVSGNVITFKIKE